MRFINTFMFIGIKMPLIVEKKVLKKAEYWF